MVQVIFEVTYSCPCNCPFCPIKKLNLDNELLPLQEYRKALELFLTVGHDHASVISGGEPSTVPFLKDYVDVARRLGYVVTIVTNAFNPMRIIEANPDLIEVSIDYFGEKHDEIRGVHGLFRRIIQLIILAEKEGIATAVRSTAMKDNITDIIRIRELLDANGFHDVPILVMPVRGSPNLKPTPKQLKQLDTKGIILSDNCPAGIESFVVTPNLEVLACIFYRKKLGQLRSFTLEELESAISEGRKLPRYPCETLQVMH